MSHQLKKETDQADRQTNSQPDRREETPKQTRKDTRTKDKK